MAILSVIKKHPVAWYSVTGIGLRNMVSEVGARDAVYWPGMAEDIYRVTKVSRCEDSPAQPRGKLLAHDIPKQPWSKVGMDLLKCKGKEFLIMVNYLTDFFEVSELPNTLASTVVEATKREFARHGIPLVHTDGGPQFM